MINIETAEKVVDLFNKKKTTARRRLLHTIVDQVCQRRDWIRNYLVIVEILSLQFDKKHQSLEKLICQLDDREQMLDQGLAKVNTQQKELERRQARMEHELQSIRALAEHARDRKLRSESQYHRVAYVPLLSSQSKKRYLEAHGQNAKAEQQLSEAREALEKCRMQLRIVSDTRSRQSLEQTQLASQRRGSVDTIQSTQQQLSFLREGSLFWTAFDSYQAQVVLESAEYLAEIEIESGKPTKQDGIDMEQLWLKIFQFACFEYGHRELDGLRLWGPGQVEVLFECVQCQMTCTGWPSVVNDHQLVCRFCFEAPDIHLSDKHEAQPDRESKSRIKRIMRSLFSYYSKIEPLSF